MAKKTTIEVLLTADGKGFSSTMNKAQRGLKTFNKTLGNSNQLAASMRNQLVGLAGAFVGLQAVGQIGTLLENASKSAYALESSLKAANRQFEVGSLERWQDTIERLSEKLRIYSKSDLQAATARTVDMTKRLGMSADQMEKIIELSGDLSAGKTDLVGGIERVTAALRGEAEASEYLGLTLNETFIKSWYEARGAMQGAWKDLSDLEKAQVRYQVFLEQAIPLQGKAAESVDTYAGAIALIKKTMSDGIGQNEDLVASLVQVAAVLNENADELGDFASKIATGAAKVIEFVAANRNLILWLGKWGLIMGVAVKALSTLLLYTRATNAAMVTMTGVKLIPWLAAVKIEMAAFSAVAGGMRGAMATAAIAAGRLAIVLGTVAAAAGSLFVGVKIGTWLYKITEPAERALSDLQQKIAETGAKYRKFAAFQPVKKTDLFTKSIEEIQEYKNELKGALRYQSAVVQQLTISANEKGFFGGLTDDAKAARIEREAAKSKLNDIDQAIDDYASAAGQSFKKVEAAAVASAASQQQVTGAALDAMKKKYQEYADKIKSINDEIADRQKSLAEKLRAMARKGMTDIGAWNDRKKEAKEYEAAAKKAAEAGNFKEAIELADQAATAYEDLNKEVKEGDDVLVSQQQGLATATDGMTRAAGIAEEALKKQRDAAAEAMDALSMESGFQDLSDGMDAAKKKWLEEWLAMKTGAVKQVKDGMVKVEREIVAVTDKKRTVYIDVVKREAKALGGSVGLRMGGKLAGYGGGDRIPALLEAGEYIIRKEAVSRFGAGIFHALNNLRLPALPALPGFATGGPVGALATGSGQSITVEFVDQASGEKATMIAPTQQDFEVYERMLRKRARLASR